MAHGPAYTAAALVLALVLALALARAAAVAAADRQPPAAIRCPLPLAAVRTTLALALAAALAEPLAAGLADAHRHGPRHSPCRRGCPRRWRRYRRRPRAACCGLGAPTPWDPMGPHPTGCGGPQEERLRAGPQEAHSAGSPSPGVRRRLAASRAEGTPHPPLRA